jgi:two-component system, NtrC family, sensor histidine kinase KinB
MKIKTKLRLGFGFLFALVLLMGGVAGFYINEISKTSKVILKDNFESLTFTRQMRRILDENDLPLSARAADQFKDKLQKQASNVTEPGERDLTEKIRQDFNSLTQRSLKISSDTGSLKNLHRNIRKIEELNMQAILKKNNKAQASVKEATLYLSLLGSITILIIFSFTVNFPGFIGNPLLELTEGIKEISKRNYQKRLDFPAYNEFGELAAAFNQMASRLNEWENSNLAKVISEKLRIETIIGKMQDAILGLDEEQHIIFINPIAKNILNLTDNEIKRHSATQLAVSNDLLKKILEYKTNEKPIKIYADGKESYFQLESHEILVPQSHSVSNGGPVVKSGEFAGEVYILRNITRYRELDEAKTNFIATISHELKTPISSIQMSLKLLNDQRIGNLNEEQQDLLNNIKNDSVRLLKITSELLDLSQVETGNIQLSFMASDPEQIVDYALGSVKFQADQKHLQLQIIMDPHLPAVYADVEKTAWVLVNLLSNAIRFSPEESKVVIQVQSAGNRVEFSVKDFGGGIEEQYQRKIFDKYFKVPSPDKSKSGTGLGLAISKDFIEAQKGEIFVESQPGTGSRFGFKLPVA